MKGLRVPGHRRPLAALGGQCCGGGARSTGFGWAGLPCWPDSGSRARRGGPQARPPTPRLEHCGAGVTLPAPQVQNVSQSMEVLELRTYRDLQYVRSMETPLRSLDARLRTADGSLSAKSFQVRPAWGLRCTWVLAEGAGGREGSVIPRAGGGWRGVPGMGKVREEAPTGWAWVRGRAGSDRSVWGGARSSRSE